MKCKYMIFIIAIISSFNLVEGEDSVTELEKSSGEVSGAPGKMSDGDIIINYSIGQDGKFVDLQVKQKGVIAFKYTKLLYGAERYYSDPRPQLAMTVEFFQEKQVASVSIVGTEISLLKSYTWDIKSKSFILDEIGKEK